MRILLVGAGAIGTALLNAVDAMPDVTHVSVLDAREGVAEAAAARSGKATAVTDFEAAVADVDLVVEAASQQAVAEFGERALHAGCDLVVVSVGALGDADLYARLADAARAANRRVHVPSGALGGLDVVKGAREARVQRVTITTTKPPRSLGRADAERTVLYEGPAREAVRAWPKNVNVAAALSLAGVGFDDTTVRIVSDPGVARNSHTVEVEGAFGEARVEVRNVPFPENPATSHLAALSVIALVRRLSEPVQVGT